MSRPPRPTRPTPTAQLADAQARLASAEAAGQDGRARPVRGRRERAAREPTATSCRSGAALFTVVGPAHAAARGHRCRPRTIAAAQGRHAGRVQRERLRAGASPGKIERVNPAVDPATRQVRIIATHPQREGRSSRDCSPRAGWPPSAQAVVVPRAAVDSAGIRPMVVRLKDGKVERVEVEPGLQDEASGAGRGQGAGSRRATPCSSAVRLGCRGHAGHRTGGSGRPGLAGCTPGRGGAADDHLGFCDQAADRHRRRDGGAGGVRHVRAAQAQDRRVPRRRAAVRRRWRSSIPARRPTASSKEILDPVEEQIASISGVKQDQRARPTDGFGLIIDRVRVREGARRGDAGHPRRDLDQARRPADEMKEPIIKKFNDTDRPIVSLALSSHDAVAGRAHAARRSGDHARAARRSRAWPRCRCSARSSAS